MAIKVPAFEGSWMTKSKCDLQFPLIQILVEASNGVCSRVRTCVSWLVRLSTDAVIRRCGGATRTRNVQQLDELSLLTTNAMPTFTIFHVVTTGNPTIHVDLPGSSREFGNNKVASGPRSIRHGYLTFKVSTRLAANERGMNDTPH